MDCGATTSNPSDDATLSQVNKWCQTDRALPGLKVQCLIFDCVCVYLGCIEWRGGFERGGEGQTKGGATQSQEKGVHTNPYTC